MTKKDLCEAGFAGETKYQKRRVITIIWVISTLVMIAFVFIFTILINVWKSSGNAFFDLLDDMAISVNQIFGQWKFAIYLFLWALIFLTLFFITKNNLREQTSASPKTSKKLGRYISHLALALLILVAFLYLLMMVSEIADSGSRSGGSDVDSGTPAFDFFAFFGEFVIIVLLVLLEIMYLAAKLVATIFVCHDKKNGIKLKILKDTAMPVCSCQEAVSFWHIVVSYLIPLVFIYSVLLWMCGTQNSENVVYAFLLSIFMSFFMAYDLTLVVYAIYLKMRHRMDYISIDHHIYEVTLFKKSQGVSHD